jgi:UDP-N-acetyl-D-mannosaminuronic acid dehydrogenase
VNLIQLGDKIDQRAAVVGVVGLGYVGLPVACAFAEAGFYVIGVDLKTDRIAQINSGRLPMEGKEPGLAELLATVISAGRLEATADYGCLAQADVILVSVETPVDKEHRPQYAALKAACRSLGPVLKPGALVIVESTIAPGTMDRVVRPLLEKASGKRVTEDFYLGACPERVMPGRLLANLRSLSRVCGGSTPETAAVMIRFYRSVVRGDLDATDCVTAETVKTAENAYRDVNIAFANELALVCEATGGDFLRVRELVNKSPGRNVLLAGGGVGGHCIPKDPWLLAYGVDDRAPLRVITAARAVNDRMPRHVMELTAEAIRESGGDLNGARVAVLGYAYLEDSDDTRNSPSAVLIEHLEAAGAEIVIHDPWVPGYGGALLERVAGCDAAVLMVAHTAYKALDLVGLRRALRWPVLVDARRIVDPGQARSAGLNYRAVGYGPRPA